MILQSLNQLYDRLAEDPTYELAPPGFSPQKVSFKIVLREDGSLFGIEDARTTNDKGKLIPRLLEVPAHEKRTSGVKAQFLCDKREYLLGISANGYREDCHEAFRRKHLPLEQTINSKPYSTICRFLENWHPSDFEKLSVPSDIFESFGIFQIVGEKEPIHKNSNVRSWWISETKKPAADANFERCIVSGKISEICRIHPDIKGFKSSVALVGIQENTSYESYGRAKTRNCPISTDVAFRYATALNALLTGPKKQTHSLSLVDSKVIFWTKNRTLVENCFTELFGSGSQSVDEVQNDAKLADLRRLFEAIRGGGEFQTTDDPEMGTSFFLLGLEQPNPGRFSVRFFHRSTVGNLLQNLHDHQKCLSIVREFDKAKGKRKPDPEFPAIWQLLLQTARVSDEIPPLLAGALTRAIIEGTKYPEGLLSAVIRRIRAEHQVNYLKAAILKAILQRNYKITMSTTLDKDHPSKGYQLGRLFAVFEQSQRQAHEFKLERTIRETFYSAASANPLSVFSRLHRLHMHHLRKLSGGSQKYFEDWVSEIEQKFQSTSNNPASYPSALPLKEQALFSIGYYHQMHAMKHKDSN